MHRIVSARNTRHEVIKYRMETMIALSTHYHRAPWGSDDGCLTPSDALFHGYFRRAVVNYDIYALLFLDDISASSIFGGKI